MKKLILFATILFATAPLAHAKNVTLSGATAPLAHAKNVTLSGAAADSFISRHFPNADIPGPVKGVFQYTDKNGNVRRGYAECFYPAMGEHSDGVETSCDVIY